MPLPSLPSKLGEILSADEIKHAPKATPPKQVLKPTQPKAKPVTASPTPPSSASLDTPVSEPAGITTPKTTPPRLSSSKKNKNQAKPVKEKTNPSVKKLFVLDTNVLLHDANCLFKFEEHDVFIPMIVLEELDHQKKAYQKSPATPAKSAAT